MTGAIDMDLIQTGVSASERIARGQLAQEIKKLLISASPFRQLHPLSFQNVAPGTHAKYMMPCSCLLFLLEVLL